MQRKWWTLIAVSVATFMLLLDITVVNVALPPIRKDLDDPGDLLVVSQWTTRQRADEVLREYANLPQRATRERARLAPADSFPRPLRAQRA